MAKKTSEKEVVAKNDTKSKSKAATKKETVKKNNFESNNKKRNC